MYMDVIEGFARVHRDAGEQSVCTQLGRGRAGRAAVTLYRENGERGAVPNESYTREHALRYIRFT